MGQYYLVANIDKKEFVSPWPYDCFGKLTEWGYIVSDGTANHFVGAVNSLLCDRWKGDRVYVVGDYADPEERDGDLSLIQSTMSKIAEAGLDGLMCGSSVGDVQAAKEKEEQNRNFILWQSILADIYEEFSDTELGEKDDKGKYKNSLFHYVCENFEEIKLENTDKFVVPRYLCNTATKEYIDLRKLPAEWEYEKKDSEGDWIPTGNVVSLYPLAILLAMGNGQGGGDYFGVHSEEAGTWCSTTKSIRFYDDIPKGFHEYEFWFTENTAA